MKGKGKEFRALMRINSPWDVLSRRELTLEYVDNRSVILALEYSLKLRSLGVTPGKSVMRLVNRS